MAPETVASAYKRLIDEGYLRSEVGRGTFVAAPPLGAEEDPLAPFEAGGALPPFAPAAPSPGPPAQRDLLRLANQPGLVSFFAAASPPSSSPTSSARWPRCLDGRTPAWRAGGSARASPSSPGPSGR